MSFRCEYCNEVSKPGTKLHLVPTRVRNLTNSEGNPRTEIVQEKKSCEPCYLKAVDCA